MKLFIIFLLMALTTVNAFFPKLVLRYDSSEDDDSRETTLVKFPKFNWFGKPTLFEKLADKKEKLDEKPTLFDKIADKKDDKFEDRLLGFFEDDNNAKVIFDKFSQYKTPKVEKHAEPEPCKCARHYDDCDDGYVYYT